MTSTDPSTTSRRAGRLLADDSGQIMLLMAGLTMALTLLAAVLLNELGRPPAASPTDSSRQAALAGAAVLRSQTRGADVPAACRSASRAAAAAHAQVVTCRLTPAGLTVITAWDPSSTGGKGQAFASAVVDPKDAGSGCLAVSPSLGDVAAPACPQRPGQSTSSAR